MFKYDPEETKEEREERYEAMQAFVDSPYY